MPKVHIKGYILQLMARNGAMWDDDIATAVLADYGLTGDYWRGTVRMTLTDLVSNGLLDEVDSKIDTDKTTHAGEQVLRFRFCVNDFGAERMAQTALVEMAK
jgi:hypothetical protein